MKKKLFNLLAILSVILITLMMLSGCGNSDNDKAPTIPVNSEDADYPDELLFSTQNKFEEIMTDIQMTFMSEVTPDTDEVLWKYITYEILDKELRKHNYNLCTKTGKTIDSKDMSSLVVDAEQIYFTDGNYTFQLKISEPMNNNRFTVDVIDFEYVK